ncbi:MAG: patatin-like phospholipase family protein [Propionibacteriaceae bacterium]|nr:patatin-like phospholipase family protein [Propionibacteriaceae bacterium]
MPHNWFNRLLQLSHRAEHTEPPQVQGLVLSGGGSRASFHIGALRYLYSQAHIAPTCIVGTSAGSIVAAMLAQSLAPSDQAENLSQLEQLWMAMESSDDMFVEQAWFTRLRAQWDDIAALVVQHGGHTDEQPTDKVVDATGDPMELVHHAMEDDPSLDMTISPGVLWQLLGSLPRIGRAGAGLAATVRGAERAASAYRPGPIVNRLLFESGFQSARVAKSGVRLRIAFVDLNSGTLRFMREDGIIVDRDDQPVGHASHDLTLGVWASCAIPGVFRPVKLGNEVYVDGGARESVPVEMAVTNLGVTRPYVIAVDPPGVEPGDFTDKDVVAVMLRVSSIILDETFQDEVEWARAAGACVIEPRLSVHSALTVEPTLLRINRDYGWMCAAEEIINATSALRDINDAIIKARCEWTALAKEPTVDEAAVSAIQARIRELLTQADETLLPPGYQTWADAL